MFSTSQMYIGLLFLFIFVFWLGAQAGFYERKRELVWWTEMLYQAMIAGNIEDGMNEKAAVENAQIEFKEFYERMRKEVYEERRVV